MPSTRLNINPDILSFARERSGYHIPDLAKKLNIKEERWQKFESGETQPTVKQLLNIASKLDRSPAFFYLQQPPEEAPVLSEFRTINSIPLNDPSPSLIKAIRESKRNRDTILEMYNLQNITPTPIPDFPNLLDDIEESANHIRSWLELSIEDQFSWKSSSNALTSWKDLIESKDIYIIQYPFVDIDEARGFALSEDILPIIGINSQDSYNGRIFTLIHELCHLLLNDSVLTNNGLEHYFDTGNKNIERLCNALAAEILVPKNSIIENFNSSKNVFQEVQKLARRYRVSTYVIAIRLKNTSIISSLIYKDIISEIEAQNYSKKSSNTGNPYNNQIVRKGRLLLKTAFNAYFENSITLPELAEITSWKVPNLNKLIAKTFGWDDGGSYI